MILSSTCFLPLCRSYSCSSIVNIWTLSLVRKPQILCFRIIFIYSFVYLDDFLLILILSRKTFSLRNLQILLQGTIMQIKKYTFLFKLSPVNFVFMLFMYLFNHYIKIFFKSFLFLDIFFCLYCLYTNS